MQAINQHIVIYNLYVKNKDNLMHLFVTCSAGGRYPRPPGAVWTGWWETVGKNF